MTALRIEICKNFRGKFDIRIGDIEGSSETSNITKEELMQEISDEIDEVFKFDFGKENKSVIDSPKKEFNLDESQAPKRSSTLAESIPEKLGDVSGSSSEDANSQIEKELNKDYDNRR